MNKKLIIRMLGTILLLEAICMLPSLVLAVAHGEKSWLAMLVSMLACAAFGLSTVPRASMQHEEIQRLLGLSEYQIPVMNNPIGYPEKK